MAPDKLAVTTMGDSATTAFQPVDVMVDDRMSTLSDAVSGRDIETPEDIEAEPESGPIVTPALKTISGPTSRMPPGMVMEPSPTVRKS